MRIFPNNVLKVKIGDEYFYCGGDPSSGGIIRQEWDDCLLYIPHIGIGIHKRYNIEILA